MFRDAVVVRQHVSDVVMFQVFPGGLFKVVDAFHELDDFLCECFWWFIAFLFDVERSFVLQMMLSSVHDVFSSERALFYSRVRVVFDESVERSLWAN